MVGPSYRKSSHTVYDNKFHLVWTTKYRYRVLIGNLAKRARDLIREICTELEVEIVKGHIAPEHVHMLVNVPPHVSVSKLMQHIKGKSSRKLQMEFKELKQKYWGQHLWARGYFCATTGVVTEEDIKRYIEEHNDEEDEDFTIKA